MKKVILTGDDFGLALPVNEAVEEAHRGGILTTASLMVGAEHCRDAAERLKNLPSLKVGLHLTLVEGKPVLDPDRVPDLVDRTGCFSTLLACAGFRFFFVPGIRKQLEAEIRAQFEAFEKMGLSLDHVNAHNHMHLHPTILGLILKVGRDFGLRAVRIPNEPPLLSWRAAKHSAFPRMMSKIFLFPWLAVMRSMLRRAGVRFNDFLFGMTDGGSMATPLVLNLIRNLPEGITEFCFHPATRRCAEIDQTMPLYRHEAELEALKSEAVARALKAAGVQRLSFSDIR